MIEPHCPNCGNTLDQLGTVVNGVWKGENLWGCNQCPYGKNRFFFDDEKKLMPCPVTA